MHLAIGLCGGEGLDHEREAAGRDVGLDRAVGEGLLVEALADGAREVLR